MRTVLMMLLLFIVAAVAPNLWEGLLHLRFNWAHMVLAVTVTIDIIWMARQLKKMK